MDENNTQKGNSRMPNVKAFEDALSFTPEGSHPAHPTERTLAAIVADFRMQAQAMLKMCDEADEAIKHSEEHARQAADTLIDLIKRVK